MTNTILLPISSKPSIPTIRNAFLTRCLVSGVSPMVLRTKSSESVTTVPTPRSLLISLPPPPLLILLLLLLRASPRLLLPRTSPRLLLLRTGLRLILLRTGPRLILPKASPRLPLLITSLLPRLPRASLRPLLLTTSLLPRLPRASLRPLLLTTSLPPRLLIPPRITTPRSTETEMMRILRNLALPRLRPLLSPRGRFSY